MENQAFRAHLLLLLGGRFDVFAFADKNLRYQQNLADRSIAIIELRTNRWPVLKALEAGIVAAANTIRPGSYTVINPPQLSA